MSVVKVCVLTCSDTCSQGLAQDLSGPLLCELAGAEPGLEVVASKVVPDTAAEIRRALVSWADSGTADIILTTGGTGFAPRDVTPEATMSVLDRPAPGLVAAMLHGSLAVTPLAALARPAAGIRGNTVIVNMPGSKKAVKECFGFLKPCLKHAVDLLQERSSKVKVTHSALQGSTAQPSTCGGHHHHQEAGPGRDRDQGDGTLAGRARQSAWPLISVAEAQEAVLTSCRALLTSVPVCGLFLLGTEAVHYRDCVGRTLAQEVAASDPLPPFRASMKDGYAVISSDGAGVRSVVGEGSTAGCSPGMAELMPGQVVRINTGAPVPAGADAVVMVESTRLVRAEQGGQVEAEVEILAGVRPGADIRPVGCDIAAGEVVLGPGAVLGPGEAGLLAAVGVTQVVVARRPVVTVLSTGNEIQEPGEELRSGHVRDSNKTSLLTALASHQVDVRDGGIARDDLATLTSSLQAALETSDLVVTTGGVSMGDRDLLRQVLVEQFGARIHFARVNMKPGKPTTFATCTVAGRPRLVLGLPGNPVSAMVTAHLYVLPACRALAGLPAPLPGSLRARLVTPAPLQLDPRPEYVRVRLSFGRGEAVGVAEPTGVQVSSRQSSMAQANGLLVLPPRSETRRTVDTGLEAEVILIGNIYTEPV